MKIVFSILHYQAINITIQCVEKILKLNLEDSEVVIVDNASNNGSGLELEKRYNDNSKVHVLLNEKNEGFARGNNVGYNFAKKKLAADIIIVMNNDVMIEQKDFVQTLKKLDISDKDIIAPDIVNLLGEHQNPFRMKRISKWECLYVLIYCMLMNIILRIPVLNTKMVNVLVKRNKRTKDEFLNTHVKGIKYDIVPHGAMVIFTKKYIQNEDIAFNPETFLFCEEDILYEFALVKNYKICYFPQLKVTHCEDVTINSVTKDELGRRKFILGKKVGSSYVLFKYRVLKKKTKKS